MLRTVPIPDIIPSTSADAPSGSSSRADPAPSSSAMSTAGGTVVSQKSRITDPMTLCTRMRDETVHGAPVFVGKAPVYRSKNAAIGIDLDIKNHNALQSTFVFDA